MISDHALIRVLNPFNDPADRISRAGACWWIDTLLREEVTYAMQNKASPLSLLASLGAILWAVFTVGAFAQISPTLPCCIDFNNPDQGGIGGSYVEQLEIRYPGFSGDAADGYLHAKDDSGPSWARLTDPNDGKPSCFGDWKNLLKPGRCLELCWDVQLVTDGDNSQVIAKPAHITIWSGSLRATFRTTIDITEQGGPHNGWYSFCAPIAFADASGNLPSNDQGEWIMNDADGNPTPDDWNELLCNVDEIAFFVDYHAKQSERWCWDNICLRDGPCPGCMDVVNGHWECEIDATGELTLNYVFDVTNLSDKIAQVGLIPDPTGVDIEPNTFDFSPDLPPGETATVSLGFDGAQAGSEVCFEFVLFNYEEGECCREEICVKVPCVKIEDVNIACSPVTGGGLYEFNLTNISGGTAEYAYLISNQPGVSISPAMIPLGGLGDGVSMPVGPVTITGAATGEAFCFNVVLLDAELTECCIQEHCIDLPDCGIGPDPVKDDNGQQLKPCDPTDPTVVTSSNGCIQVCSDDIICDPDHPGDYLYTFNVANLGTSVVSHILFPSTNVTPNQVLFGDPLDPGEAAQVTVTISGASAGLFTLPIVLVGLDDCSCCSFLHEIDLPECDCVQVSDQELDCEGTDPTNPGLLCYTYSATLHNTTTDTLTQVFFFPEDGNPLGIAFDPAYVNLPGGLPPGGFTNVTTTVKIPVGTTEIHFILSVHNTAFVECCAVKRWLLVPDCCDCDELVHFEFVAGLPAGLPEGLALINLEQHPETGKLGFPPDGKIAPFPYVYMAASQRGTVVRIHADTGVILGEYWTAPETNFDINPQGGLQRSNPSRTTVDKFGECWLGNRNNYIPPANPYVPGTVLGSVMRLGLVIGGTRGDRLGPSGGPYTFAPNPAGEYLQGPFTYVSPSVVDRDGDGFIRTSAGLGNILEWDTALTGGDDPGTVLLADDECIVNFVRTPDNAPRALAIDSNNDLWVGGLNSSIYQQLDGVTGAPGVQHTVAGGYGALIDENDVLWSVQSGAGVYRHDLVTLSTTFTSAFAAYGIGINPCDGHIWVSGRGFPTDLFRIDPGGTVVGTWAQPGGAQGLSVDQNGHVWLSGPSLHRFDGVGTWLPSILVSSTGNAVDHNGKIWASDQLGDAARRIDPAGVGTVDLTANMGPDAGPYNYSDMTGYVTLGAAGQTGIALYTHDGECEGTQWGNVTWGAIGESDEGCSISAEVRASDDSLDFPTTWLSVDNGVSFCPNPVTLGVVGRYLQVRFIFNRPSGCPPPCSPELCWFSIECCDAFGIGPGNNPPVVEISDPIFFPNPPGTPIVVGAHTIDLDGDEALDTTWSVNGRVITNFPPDVNGNAEFAQVYALGLYLIDVEVSDGSQTTRASTSVMIGDQVAPVVNCLVGPFVSGNLRVKDLQVPIPDVLSLAIATDNITPSAQLIMAQQPRAGDPVGQGVHPIIVTATDAAGNIGSCTVHLIVEAVVSIASLSNYDLFPLGTLIPVELAYDIKTGRVSRTTIYVDGLPVHSVDGPLEQILMLDLSVGSHHIYAVVEDAAGNRSQSAGRTVRNTPPALPIQAILDPTQGNPALLTFQAPEGVRCCVQMRNSLTDGVWHTIHVVDGKGNLVEFLYPVDLDEVDKIYFRLVYVAD
ncbi:MAG: hypothetical protein ACI97B_003535 [Verrucomicrobiales bacterium]